jgi:3-methyladenine DNA glycosylase AlkD
MDKDQLLKWLNDQGSRRVVNGMSRYGIETKVHVLGVPMGTMFALGKRLHRELDGPTRHGLALELWANKGYEARIMASLIDDPKLITRTQMNTWVGDFDNWAICDTVCFKLFDQSQFAFERAMQWVKSPKEFIKRTGFVMMACLAAHDKTASDTKFIAMLPIIERGASDERNFVKKGVSWALRMIGRRNTALRKAALPVARRLAQSEEPSCRWVGKDALREFNKMKTKTRAARDRSRK